MAIVWLNCPVHPQTSNSQMIGNHLSYFKGLQLTLFILPVSSVASISAFSYSSAVSFIAASSLFSILHSVFLGPLPDSVSFLPCFALSPSIISFSSIPHPFPPIIINTASPPIPDWARPYRVGFSGLSLLPWRSSQCRAGPLAFCSIQGHCVHSYPCRGPLCQAMSFRSASGTLLFFQVRPPGLYLIRCAHPGFPSRFLCAFMQRCFDWWVRVLRKPPQHEDHSSVWYKMLSTSVTTGGRVRLC